MSIAFQCDQCGKRYAVKEELAGKAVKCKGCARTLRIPGASHAATAPATATPPPALDIYGLDEEPAAKLASGGQEEEEAPLPRAGASSTSPKRGKDKEKTSFGQKGFGATVGGVVILALFCLRFYNRVIRPFRGDSRVSATAPANPASLIRQEAPITPVVFPEVGPGEVLEPGVRLHEVRIGPPGPVPMSPGHRGKLWLYVPDGPHEPKSLPCVLMAGAGSNLITGMDLGDGDRPEQLPYARAGFAVLAYELDGAMSNPKNEVELVRSCAAFLAAQAGLVNARNALDFLASRVPEVDPGRIYTAGHSSAGTMALLAAEHEPRIKGCVAFAPVVDMNQRLPADALSDLARVVPGAGDFLTRYNPRLHEDGFQGPVFLFHAQDDSNVPVAQSLECKARLEQLGKPVTLHVVPTGDHYQGMLAQGIPQAILWLRQQAGMPDEGLAAAEKAARGEPAPRPRLSGPRGPRGPMGGPRGPVGGPRGPMGGPRPRRGPRP